MESLASFFTFDHILEIILASGLIASLLPPINEALDRGFGNRYVKAAFSLLDAMRDGISEEEFVAFATSVYKRVAPKP